MLVRLKSNKKNIITNVLLLLILFLNISQLWANSIESAEQLVKEERYAEAMKILDEINENTPEAFYLKGLCLYELNLNPYEAIVILSKAMSAGGPDRIKLILGLLYHRQYKTEEAIRLFKEYLSLTKDSDEKELTLRYIEYCQNILAVAHRGKQIDILSTLVIPEKEAILEFNKMDINGVILPKSFDLNTKEDESNKGENSIMILPKDAESITYVYYSAYQAGRPDHSDIFRVKVLENGEFSEIESLGGTINTNYDEKYPYFDEENQVLYFASKGHQSIGGYDIFMSYYNAGAESWSKPINVGLPVNSSDDDYMYIPTEIKNEYLFLTSRNASYDNTEIVRINIPPGASYKTLLKPNDILAFNSLKEDVSGDNSKDITLSNSNSQNDPNYKELVEKALHYQVKADSVNRRIHEQQQKINVALGASRKQQLEADMKIMQQEYRVLKEKADVHYDAVREYEKRNNMIASDMPVRKTEKINDIQVYEYNPVTETKTPPVAMETTTPEPIPQTQKPPVSATINITTQTKKSYKTADDLPNGIIFTVQIGVFSKKVDKDNFSGLNDIFYYFISDRNLYKYNSGVYLNIDLARKHLDAVKDAGYPDAFLTAYQSGKPVSIEKAIQMSQNN